MKNKVLAMLLALCMVMSLLPVSVFAATEKVNREAMAEVTESEGEVTPGEGDDAPATQAVVKISNADPHPEGACSADGCTCYAIKETKTTTETMDPEEGDEDGEAVTVKVTTTTYTWGPLCAACKAEKEAADKAAAEAAATAAAAAKRDCSVENPTGSADCKNFGNHEATCVAACGAGGVCKLDKDHEGDHDNSECINMEGCSSSKVSSHKMTCPSYEKDAAEAGKDNEVATVDVVVTVTECNCEDDAHDEEHSDCEQSFKRTLTVSFLYSWETKSGSTALEADAIATKKADAKKAAEAAIKAKTLDDLSDSDTEIDGVDSWECDTTDADICDTCQAAIAAAADKAAADAKAEEDAAKAALIAEKLANCTMAATCEAGDEPEYHHDDCLSQCTMDSTCENSVGVSSAHRVKYAVKLDGEIVETYEEYEKALKAVNDLNKARWTAEELAWAELKENTDDEELQEAYADALAEAQKDLYVTAIHCPQSKVPDGVVIAVEADGTVAETPEEKPEETKAPEKATDFEDVKDGAWYIPELNALMAKGIVKGSLDGGVYRFKATDKMTTDYLVVFLSRVLDKGLKTEGAGWADEANAWAKEEGLLDGIEAGEIDRKDVVLVLWRAMGKTEAEQDLSKFEDAAGLEGDHLAAMQWAVSAGVVKGDGDTGTLKTDDVITRAEMIAMLARLDVSEK